MASARVPAQSVRPRYRPAVVQFAGVGLSSLLGAFSARVPSLAPFAALPALAAFGISYFLGLPRAVEIEATRMSFRLFEKGQMRREAKIESVRLLRAITPGLSTTAGDALELTLRSEGRSHEKYILATHERSQASAADPAVAEIDAYLTGGDFDALVHVLPKWTTDASSERGPWSIVVVERRGTGAILGGIGLIGVILLAATALALTVSAQFRGELAQKWLSGGIGVLAVAGVLFAGRKMFAAPKESLFELDEREARLKKTTGEVLDSAPLDALEPERKVYVFHSKYGSYRFPTLELTLGARRISIGLWESRADFLDGGAPEGRAPHFLTNAQSFDALFRQLRKNGHAPR